MPDRYAYLGPEGTFTEAALVAFDPGAREGAIPCASVQATLDAVHSGEADRAIVPIENSVEGAVTATLDELATGPDIVICAELLLPVTFALLARPGTALGDIKTVGGQNYVCDRNGKWIHVLHIAAGGPSTTTVMTASAPITLARSSRFKSREANNGGTPLTCGLGW